MDLNRNAFRIVNSLTEENKEHSKIANAQIVGRAGGRAGGPARAKRLTAEERRDIALKANRARWHRSA